MLQKMFSCFSSCGDNNLVPKEVLFDFSSYDEGKLQYLMGKDQGVCTICDSMLKIMLSCFSSYEDDGMIPKGILFDCSLYYGGKFNIFKSI